MLRVVLFHNTMQEYHWYKLLSNCNQDDYMDFLPCGGMTALYDASENAILAHTHYADDLSKHDYSVNSIVIVVTDGCDNASSVSASAVKDALEAAVKSEATESIVSILIGVGTASEPQVSQELSRFAKEAGFNQYVETQNANAKTLAKLAAFVSKSISAQSQALGTGGASQLIPPDLGI
jgi:uncharacterized protein YegL